jgi:hypothetical protein
VSAERKLPEDYLGDGVYVTWDGYSFWLDVRGQEMPTTRNGVPSICLEPSVLGRLVEFANRCAALAKAGEVKP